VFDVLLPPYDDDPTGPRQCTFYSLCDGDAGAMGAPQTQAQAQTQAQTEKALLKRIDDDSQIELPYGVPYKGSRPQI
jgi:hypothetical protein